jgi:Tol biopolymer transport system component
VVDLDRNVPARLTASPRSEMDPRLSPDGTQLVFSADWTGPPNLYLAPADGGEPKVLVPFDRTQQTPGGWTPDATQVVYAKRNESFGLDIWTVDVTSGKHQAILATAFGEGQPSLSPDGTWLAYVSDASGRREVYLREFPTSSWQVRLSVDGGGDPLWRGDGRELFYYQPDGSLMAVQVRPGPSSRPVPGAPSRLFTIDTRAYRTFAVTPRGDRFLLNLTEPGGLSPRDEVIVDWKRLMRTGGQRSPQ